MLFARRFALTFLALAATFFAYASQAESEALPDVAAISDNACSLSRRIPAGGPTPSNVTRTIIFMEAMAPTRGQDAISEDVKTVAAAVQAFTFDLYDQLSQQQGNLFFSPASVSTALAMTLGGAAGQTEKQIAHVLHADDVARLPSDRLHAAYGTLHRLLNSGGNESAYVLRTANRLWAQQSHAFLPTFLKITREDYGAELAKLDFHQTEKARREINHWVEQQTNNKIVNLVPPGALATDTRLVITNAIYFLGGWQHEFDKQQTKDAPFFIKPSQTAAVPLMTQTERFRYGETEQLQILELPYRGYEISMLVFLPRKTDGLAAIERALSAETARRELDALGSRKVRVFMPKFRVTSEFSLKKVLSALGMPAAFSDAADFSRLASGESLMISEVLHKAFVDVNEKGTEAAAATGVILAPTSARPRPEEPVVFRADHPFLFFIRDNRSGTILFVGRVTDPRQ